ncbi:S-layer homology domain-containing protein [Wukongibacter sp. M2B1]|uniref:S-layer homology domain-containing protein n=1 Tax=Wukongibacter sp. M2B1 TaxID=3088895 RepID=UPI003D78C0CE
MLKKFCITICIVLVAVSSSKVAYGDFEEVLKDHWAKDIVNEEFVKRNFPHLLKMDSKYFEPDSNIAEESFTEALERFILFYDEGQKLGLDKLLNEKIMSNDNLEKNQESKIILRKDAAEIIANLLDTKLQEQSIEISFKDIQGLEETYIEAIRKLYAYGIVKGNFEEGFEPEKPVTQIEAIIMLQRLEAVVKESMKIIPFNVTNKESLNSGKEGFEVKESDGKVIVNITKALPNPGYDVEIGNVKRILKGRYKIDLETKTPDPDKIYAQVITYKNITFEVNKELLDSEYKFDLSPFELFQLSNDKF